MSTTRVAGRTSGAVNPQTSSTLTRGLQVLERVAMAQAAGLGVTELSSLSGLEKSTASRVLATLREAGYVRQDPARRYHLTAKLAKLANGYSVSHDVRTVSRPVLASLHEQYDEEIHLAVINGPEMIFVDYLPSSQPVRSTLPTLPAALHRVAVGIAVLARLDHEERSYALGQAMRRPGEHLNSTERDELSAAIASAQERGWADYDAGDDISRIAAAFTDASGEPLGALCLSGPSYRMAGLVEDASAAVREAADRISAALA